MNMTSASGEGSHARRRRRRGPLGRAFRFRDGIVVALERTRPGRWLARAWRGSFSLARAPEFAALAVFLFMLINSLDFYVLLSLSDFEFTQTHTGNRGTVDDPRRATGGQIHLLVSLFIYAAGAILAFVHRATLWTFLRANPHFALVIALLATAVLRSENGGEVARSVVQITIGLVIAIAYGATHARRPYRALAVVVFVPLFLVHVGSAVLFFVEGLNYTGFIASRLRFGGLAGHPNSLGGQCVIGIWAALALATDRTSPKGWRVAGFLGIFAFAFTVSVTGSATALVATLAVAVFTATLRLLSTLDVRFRPLAIIGILLAVFVIGGGLYIQRGAGEIMGELTESVGKDATFTGRTELWTTGIAAASARPLLGWGLDNHAAVKSERAYRIRVVHYHNGFIDTWVAAGGLVLMLLLYEMWRFLTMSLKSVIVEPGRSILLPTLVFLIILNLTEYSLLRPLSGIYEIFLCAWALLWFSLHEPSATGRASSRSGVRAGGSGRPRRSERRMSW